ncbi:hypothetical protein NBE98_09650 [Clostridium swellfunianum]|uniref:hypothetical protein n=1 Tax=Clostridium swellfunianum TaxID=1367462 RepID=UPI00202FEC5E|nr:hypothetical protein [Clostridium swellfunianum]MCM0648637.1 hypothetical protein [Clostridium swellfunianum]
MAKEKRTVRVNAKINLKYDKDVVKIGQEFLVRKSDIEDIGAYVEVLGEVDKEASKGDGASNEDDKKSEE